ncbi:Peptidoglycan/xylan/chitin deacetylase, PgdA/CDA1 family [Amycolatopsis arida]|uniref:Peptidoglycan/xylan/chitin deacetylase, PgdA/CDA1 family n=1 Tax=Amycolatopsis arida TaxID=587909 RepID=A0A1I6AKQ7_9PSEU|nr:peptidoglycan/xylan/chitin deacetylase (PgdA/CDA1 family) [Amycolatopsis arida]SFQ69266.1 Peptidoglycan/xylan/chitin deacetylase, PgdA/CDA1 family [Amycolatopsis arida]
MLGRRMTALLGAVALSLAACSGPRPAPPPEVPPSEVPPPTDAAVASPPPDPAEVGANELGLVPVLMYHRIVPEPASPYDRSPADFRAELERLAREGYVPVTAADFVSGRIELPAGAHPVVLTFDDGTASQFALGPDGQPAPGTAVAILLEVARDHPGFTPVATFYVNADPFEEPGGARSLRWLHEHGFEIGNHTAGHANLGRLGAEQARRQIAEGDRLIRQAVPEAAPVTLALPFGVHPDDPELARRGDSYDYRGVMLVGANPAPSPFAAKFDPLRVPRIRSQGSTGAEAEFGSASWLDQLPSARYTSDGDPDRISFPRRLDTELAAEFRAKAAPY